MNTEFRKLLDKAVRSNKITAKRKVEIETDYCYVQVYRPSELQKFVASVTKELSD